MSQYQQIIAQAESCSCLKQLEPKASAKMNSANIFEVFRFVLAKLLVVVMAILGCLTDYIWN